MKCRGSRAQLQVASSLRQAFRSIKNSWAVNVICRCCLVLIFNYFDFLLPLGSVVMSLFFDQEVPGLIPGSNVGFSIVDNFPPYVPSGC